MNVRVENEPYELGWLGVLKTHVESLRFGTVQVVVHDARVVQIEKTERVRFDKAERSASAVDTRETQRP